MDGRWFVALLLPLWEIWFAAYRYAQLREGYVFYRPSNADFGLTAVFLWLLIIFLRQVGRADARPLPLWRKLWRPQGRPARAARDLALISLLPAALTAVLLLQSKFNLPVTTASALLSVGLLFTMLLFALVYLNYLSEQTSFMVRLNAVTLAFFLAILGAVGQAMTPSFIAAYNNRDLITAPQTLRFTPNTQGGYDIARIPYEFSPINSNQDENEWGKRLTYDEAQNSPLNFEFPFYNQRQSTLFMLWNGGVRFGKKPDLDGVFEMTFVDLPASLLYDINKRWQTARMLGVLPGTAHTQPEYIRFNSDLPFSSGPDGTLEDYRLDFRTALHAFLIPLFWLTLFSAWLVPLGLSLVLGKNVGQPLQNCWQASGGRTAAIWTSISRCRLRMNSAI